MKALIIVADVSYKGEYSMAVQALRQLSMEVSTGLVSKTANINFDIDLSRGVGEDLLTNYDLAVFIAGYWLITPPPARICLARLNPWLIGKPSKNYLLSQ
ncbi:hypothetical protein [Vulcanisaeta souniana]|uniref:hypothetical protein n=1 Tax=Vulcanisaeta souniana TaxID=164452 RepID=UPI000A60D9E3|nr:hypothetical protein [Vulcanisaeta souniana]